MKEKNTHIHVIVYDKTRHGTGEKMVRCLDSYLVNKMFPNGEPIISPQPI